MEGMVLGRLGILKRRLQAPGVRDQIFRIISIALILIAVGACVVLVLAFVMQLHLLLVVFSGVLSVAVAFYLFIRLWPRNLLNDALPAAETAVKKPEPKPLSPEEYRRQRARAQQMIRDKAAPALAKAIRGILRQGDAQQQQAWRKRRKR